MHNNELKLLLTFSIYDIKMRLRSWAPSLTLLWGAYRLRGAYVYGKEGNYRERKGRVGLERRKERKIGNERQRNYKYPFLRASAMLKHVIDIGWTSVCLSVCHTLALYQNG